MRRWYTDPDVVCAVFVLGGICVLIATLLEACRPMGPGVPL